MTNDTSHHGSWTEGSAAAAVVREEEEEEEEGGEEEEDEEEGTLVRAKTTTTHNSVKKTGGGRGRRWLTCPGAGGPERAATPGSDPTAESDITGMEAHTTPETHTWFNPPIVTVARGVAAGKNPTSRSHR
ncbi:unnamed protein product [Schistocephalus solidus]|uniref:Uncharacterized protein n=1 Tax=Schistocephalus solidus TaxID=70667 RepID=A0A183T8G9_SCHSO|nr:unnamed protein product [Schistocephalus solidus]